MTPLERSRKALEGVNIRATLEASNIEIEVAVAIADLIEHPPEGEPWMARAEWLLANSEGFHTRKGFWSGPMSLERLDAELGLEPQRVQRKCPVCGLTDFKLCAYDDCPNRLDAAGSKE